MQVFSWNDICDKTHHIQKKSALTIGGFDGPHIGHEALFDKVIACKKDPLSDVSLAGIITFKKTPRAQKQKSTFLGDLASLSLRQAYFKKKGFDFCVVIDFSPDFSRISGSDFLTVLRQSCSMQFLTVGTDFHCGRNLDTGVFEIGEYCSQFGIDFSVCGEVLHNGERISSSSVRYVVTKGNMALAKTLLGYNYALDASTFTWHTESGSYNSMTAEKTDSSQVLPPEGIYPVKAAGFDTYLYVESNFLRLEIPPEQGIPAAVKKIEFILTMKE